MVNPVTERFDLVVVGGGLAGLRAADVAVATGATTAVLEANDRVGGRVWTHRFADGQWCERGAEFVDTSHVEVLALAKRFGLQLLASGGGLQPVKRRLDIAGRVTSFADHPSMLADVERWEHAKADLAASIDLDDLASAHCQELDRHTAAQLVADLGLSLAARVVIGRELRTEFMVPPDQLSLLHLAWIAALDQLAGPGQEAYRIDGGADQLATCLAAGLHDGLRLSTIVSAVDTTTGEVRTTAGDRFIGTCVIIAVPPSVLSRIDITPSPPARVTAIGWGVGAKVSTQYARRIWLDEGGDGSVISERSYGELWEASIGQGGDSGVLTALLSSHDGAVLASLPDVAQRIRGEVARVFPGSGAMARETVVTNWTNERFALGCYAAFAPGQITETLPLLQQHYGVALLAGEHTDRFAGFMEGALRSGRRAANAAANPAANPAARNQA